MNGMNPMEEETLRKVAEISRLKLSQEELSSFAKELEQILSYFSKIKKMGEGEAAHYGRELRNSLRKDEARECGKDESEKIVSNFCKREGRFLSVPKSLE